MNAKKIITDWKNMILNVLVWITLWSFIDAYMDEEEFSNEDRMKYMAIGFVVLVIIGTLDKSYTIF